MNETEILARAALDCVSIVTCSFAVTMKDKYGPTGWYWVWFAAFAVHLLCK